MYAIGTILYLAMHKNELCFAVEIEQQNICIKSHQN